MVAQEYEEDCNRSIKVIRRDDPEHTEGEGKNSRYCVKVCVSPRGKSRNASKSIENSKPTLPPPLNGTAEVDDWWSNPVLSPPPPGPLPKTRSHAGSSRPQHRRRSSGICEAGIQCSPIKVTSEAQTIQKLFQTCGIQTSKCEKSTKDCQTELDKSCDVVGESHNRKSCTKPCCIKKPGKGEQICSPNGCQINKSSPRKPPTPMFPFVGRTPSGNFKVRPEMVTYQNHEFGVLVANPCKVRTTVKRLENCTCDSTHFQRTGLPPSIPHNRTPSCELCCQACQQDCYICNPGLPPPLKYYPSDDEFKTPKGSKENLKIAFPPPPPPPYRRNKDEAIDNFTAPTKREKPRRSLEGKPFHYANADNSMPAKQKPPRQSFDEESPYSAPPKRETPQYRHSQDQHPKDHKFPENLDPRLHAPRQTRDYDHSDPASEKQYISRNEHGHADRWNYVNTRQKSPRDSYQEDFEEGEPEQDSFDEYLPPSNNRRRTQEQDMSYDKDGTRPGLGIHPMIDDMAQRNPFLRENIGKGMKAWETANEYRDKANEYRDKANEYKDTALKFHQGYQTFMNRFKPATTTTEDNKQKDEGGVAHLTEELHLQEHPQQQTPRQMHNEETQFYRHEHEHRNHRRSYEEDYHPPPSQQQQHREEQYYRAVPQRHRGSFQEDYQPHQHDGHLPETQYHRQVLDGHRRSIQEDYNYTYQPPLRQQHEPPRHHHHHNGGGQQDHRHRRSSGNEHYYEVPNFPRERRRSSRQNKREPPPNWRDIVHRARAMQTGKLTPLEMKSYPTPEEIYVGAHETVYEHEHEPIDNQPIEEHQHQQQHQQLMEQEQKEEPSQEYPQEEEEERLEQEEGEIFDDDEMTMDGDSTDTTSSQEGKLSEGSLQKDATIDVLPNLDTQQGLVLLFGGLDPKLAYGVGNAGKSIYLYTPETNQWTKVGVLPHPRTNFGLARVGNDIFIIGGTNPEHKNSENGKNIVMNTNLRLNLRSGQWDYMKALEKPRSHFGCVAIGHHIYIIGGHIDYKASTSCLIYNPVMDHYNKIAPLGVGRSNMGIAVYGYGVMVAGGTTKEAQRPVLETVTCYDPTRKDWVPWTNLPTPRAFCNLVTVKNKLYLVAGAGMRDFSKRGNYSLPDILCYNDDKDEWEVVGMLNSARHAHTSAVLADGSIIVIGGVSSRTMGALASVEIFSPANGQSRNVKNVSQNKLGMAALLL